jgi:biotin transport system substrate-specific component
MIVNTLGRFKTARVQIWQWERNASWPVKLALACAMACLIGLMAQVRVPLPWSPVPITGQTFAVLVAAVILGRWWGGASLAIYLGLGAAGVPWFNNWTAGPAAIAGPTGGYLLGFLPAALLVGYLVDKYNKTRSFISLLVMMLLADFVLVFGPGLIQLHFWLNIAGGKNAGLYPLLAMGLLPFIIGDTIKVIAAAGIAWVISPKEYPPGQ